MKRKLLNEKLHSKTYNRGSRLTLKSLSFSRFAFLRNFGLQSFLIVSKTYGRISAEQIEAARRVLRRLSKKKRDSLYVRVYPYITLTKKPAQARMGRGKGSKSGGSICFVQPGKTLFEIETSVRVSKKYLQTICLKASKKLSVSVCCTQLKKIFLS